MSKLAVIYYSATGHGTTMAQHVANAGERAGAEVRVRHIAETHDPTSFAHNLHTIPPGPPITRPPRIFRRPPVTTSCGRMR